uniref:Gustatory receptor n=1 Tax=Plectus sambesii TaxID=2011161 RepID=A0A914XJT5_9BILA
MTRTSTSTIVQLDDDRKRSSVRLGSMETVDALGVESRLFGVIKVILKYSGLHISERSDLDNDDGDIVFNNNNTNRKHAPILRRLRLIGFFIISSLVVYRALALAYKCDLRAGLTQESINQFAVTSWATQSVISLVAVGWWQYSGFMGRFCHLLVAANKFRGSQTPCGNRHIKIRICLLLLTTVLGVGVSLGTSLGAFVTGGQLFATSANVSDIFAIRALYPLYFLALAWSMIVWFMALGIYVMSCGATLAEISHFNSDLVEAGRNGHMNHPDLLVGLFMKHGDLCAIIHHLNRSFEVYTLLIAGTNIPCTIATIYTLIKNYQKMHSEGFYLICFSAGLAIVQLWALSVTPARIYDQIREAKEILYAEKSVWNQFNEKTYAIANTFTSRIAQANIGIGLWGFAIINKPLILTTISLFITYLSLLLQLQARNRDSVISVTPGNVPFNATLTCS